MEAEVGEEGEFELGRHHEGGVDGIEAPVKGGDEDSEGGGGDAEEVLDEEEARGEGDVGEGPQEEGRGGKGEADDGQVLEVPAIGVVAGKISLTRDETGDGISWRV